MELTKEIKNDRIEIVYTYNSYPVIQVRTATMIKEDDEVISKNYHRHILNPDANISGESDEIKRIATAVFTASVKTAYQDYLDSLTPNTDKK